MWFAATFADTMSSTKAVLVSASAWQRSAWAGCHLVESHVRAVQLAARPPRVVRLVLSAAAWSSTPDITKDRESFTSRRARSLSRRSAVSLSAWTASRTSRSSVRTASASDVKLAATRVTGLPRRPSASSCAPPRSRPLSRRPTRLAGALTQSCQLRPCPPHLPRWMRARCPEYPAAPRWERSLRTLEDGTRPHTLAAGGVRQRTRDRCARESYPTVRVSPAQRPSSSRARGPLDAVNLRAQMDSTYRRSR